MSATFCPPRTGDYITSPAIENSLLREQNLQQQEEIAALREACEAARQLLMDLETWTPRYSVQLGLLNDALDMGA